MWKTIIVWIWVLLGLAGCARLPVDGTVCVVHGSSEELIAWTDEAAEGWRASSDGRVNLRVIVAYGDDPACDATVSAGILEDAAGTCFNCDGFGPRDIVIDTLHRYRGDFAVVVAHELGHAMGADHTAYERDTMWSYEGPQAGPQRGLTYERNWPPTAADVAQVIP